MSHLGQGLDLNLARMGPLRNISFESDFYTPMPTLSHAIHPRSKPTPKFDSLCPHPRTFKREDEYLRNNLLNSLYNHYVSDFNGTTVIFKCQCHHDLVYGDLIWKCSDKGEWQGESPLCRPSLFWSRAFLPWAITVTVTVLASLFFGIDFYLYCRRTRPLREHRQSSYQIYQSKRKAMGYPLMNNTEVHTSKLRRRKSRLPLFPLTTPHHTSSHLYLQRAPRLVMYFSRYNRYDLPGPDTAPLRSQDF